MAITRPTGEQLLFKSQKTGDHVLDAYLESTELGNRTLPDLLSDIFNASGVIHQSLLQIRLTPIGVLEYRVGQFLDANTGWQSTGYQIDLIGDQHTHPYTDIIGLVEGPLATTEANVATALAAMQNTVDTTMTWVANNVTTPAKSLFIATSF